MQALRNASFFARLVLAWFALSLGAALASPLVKPVGVELVCSGAGALKLLVQDSHGHHSPGTHTLDCPLCAVNAPPPVAHAVASPPLAAQQAVRSVASSRVAAQTAAPPPARGPPLPLFI
jgi:hypothetical protein